MRFKRSKIVAFIIVIVFVIALALVFIDRYGYRELLLNDIEESEKEYTIIDSNFNYKYLSSGEDPLFGNEWTSVDFNDDNWKSGVGEISEAAFVRAEFNYAGNLKDFTRLRGLVSYKDAVIIYLNGQIISAANVLDGGYESYLEYGAADIHDAAVPLQLDVSDLSALRIGKNVLSFEIHKSDENSNSIFMCNDMYLINADKDGDILHLSGIQLSPGEDSDSIVVSWVSEKDTFYELLYSDVSGPDFSKNASQILMERHILEDGKFLHKATIKNLCKNMKYQYAICEVGREVASKIATFKTDGVSQNVFYVISSNGAGSELNNIINSGDILLEPNMITKRNAECFKKNIAVTLSDDGDNQCYIYKDLLIITINGAYNDINSHVEYIEKKIKDTNRKWLFVMMNPSLLNDGEIIEDKEKWKTALDELGVNVLISGEGTPALEQFNEMKMINVGDDRNKNFVKITVGYKNIKIDEE